MASSISAINSVIEIAGRVLSLRKLESGRFWDVLRIRLRRPDTGQLLGCVTKRIRAAGFCNCMPMVKPILVDCSTQEKPASSVQVTEAIVFPRLTRDVAFHFAYANVDINKKRVRLQCSDGIADVRTPSSALSYSVDFSPAKKLRNLKS
jgi:hypothetical protein